VRKKSFIIMTFALPFLMSLVMAIPAMLMRKSFTERRVVVIDGTDRLAGLTSSEAATVRRGKVLAALTENDQTRQAGRMKIDYVAAPGNAKKAAEPYVRRLSQTSEKGAPDALLVVPDDAIGNPNGSLMYYSRSGADLVVQERISRMVNRALQRVRLTERGVRPGDLNTMLAEMDVDAVQVSKTGEQKRGGEMNLMVSFVFAALLVVPVFLYGVEIMRGIVQEKTDRVVEVLISSVSATQLLGGKIAGLAAVGLTQLGVWMVMASALAAFGVASSYMAGMNILQFLRPEIFAFFFIFFLLGYLLFVCIYAVGGAASSSEKDAQQLLAPIIMVMMLPWFLLVPIITNPESSMAVWLSMIPLFAPITMFVRILISEPPVWQILLSIALTIATIMLMLKAAAKIFRIGILTYGKRATIPEILRWMKQA
jgi:ABC-2 type transport system permease protein